MLAVLRGPLPDDFTIPYEQVRTGEMMNFRKKVREMCLTLLLLVVVSPTEAGAHRTGTSLPSDSFRMSTKEPIMVENKLLPPGIYIWKRMDSLANHNIVQISNEKTHRVEATVIAIPNSRDQPANSNEVDFWETPKGYPRAVRAWFLAGDTFGQEFPYPTHMAMILLRPSPSLLTRPSVEPVAEHLRPVKPASQKSQSVKAHSKADAPESSSWAIITDSTSVNSGSPPRRQTIKRSDSIWDGLRRLPLTATLAPLFGLVGVISLGLFAMSYARKKKQQDGNSVS